MISLAVRSIGLTAPGLAGWRASLPILQGNETYQREALPPLKPELLKPNERRRTTQTIKLALVTAHDALYQVEAPDELLSVFASTQGDLDIINQICLALTREDRPVSPTQFHNSVHNAPAGYWSIGTGFQTASTSLACLTGSFASGLLEAAVQIETESKPALLVCYDLPAPSPLDQLIGDSNAFATALLLAPAAENGVDRIATLNVQTEAGGMLSQLRNKELEALRISAPAARSLPLLQSLARRESARLQLPYLDNLDLSVEVSA
jgi:hypothetical protein